MTLTPARAAVSFAERLVAWFSPRRAQHPWRRLWSETADPYCIWVSEIMLQQTTLAAVQSAYQRFMMRFPSVVDLARAPEEDVRRVCAGLGYYRRFSMLHRGAKIIAETIPICWPQTAAAWRQLPGVGEYTSAAIASITAGERLPVIDGNVERVLSRYFALRGNVKSASVRTKLRLHADALLDGVHPGVYNEAIMELGQTTCTRGTPRCGECPVSSTCRGYALGVAASLPELPKRPEKLPVKAQLTIVTDGERIALFSRPSDAKFLRHSWGFLTCTDEAATEDAAAPAEAQNLPGPLTPDLAAPSTRLLVGRFRHTITNHDIRAEVWSISASEPGPKLGSKADRLDDLVPACPRWVEASSVNDHLVASFDRKAWKIYCSSTPIPGS